MVADRFASAQGKAQRRLRVSHWQQDGLMPIARCVLDTQPDQGNDPAILILPPSLLDPLSTEAAAPLARWLKERHAAGAALGSVCAGAFLLAETGLLAGRTVTTHWTHFEGLSARFPD